MHNLSKTNGFPNARKSQGKGKRCKFMKLVRFLGFEDVKEMCGRYGFYTRGDCEAYKHLLYDLCDSAKYGDDLTIERLEKISRDIVDHSDRSAFKPFGISFKGECIQEVAQLLSNRIKILMVP